MNNSIYQKDYPNKYAQKLSSNRGSIHELNYFDTHTFFDFYTVMKIFFF